MGRRLGDADDPLLVSVRSGAKFSMPGMMETVLNVGLNDASVERPGRAQRSDERFAWDSYRRLLQMFGETVLDIDAEHFADALDAGEAAPRAPSPTSTSTPTTCAGSSRPSRRSSRSRPGATSRRTRASSSTSRSAPSSTPGTPTARGSTAARSGSPTTSAPRSTSRRWSSATSAWTPAPASPSPATRRAAHQGVYGDYLQNAQGEDVVAGIRNTVSLADLAEIDRTSYDELMGIMTRLERHYRDMCDIEFTVERGKLWMLQTRVGKRTAEAAFRIAVHMVDEGLIEMDEALLRVTGDQLAQLMFPRFDEHGRAHPARHGHDRLAGRRGRQGGLRLRHRGRSGRARARTSSWSAGRPTPTTCAAWSPPAASSPAAAARPRTPPSSPAAWAGPACAAPRRSTSTPRARSSGVRDGGDGARGRRDLHRRHAPARSSSARCRCPTRVGGPPLRGREARRRPGASAGRRGSWPTPTAPGACGCAPTPTPPRTPPAPAASARRASACAAPSTCSSASAASWSSS